GLHFDDLVIVHEMAHSRVERAFDARTEPPEHAVALDHALLRNVTVHVAASEKHRRAAECTDDVIPGRARGTDQSAAQHEHAAVAPRVAYRELCRQAGSLRKAEQADLVRRKTMLHEIDDERLEDGESGAQSRLVLRSRRHEAERIPRSAGGGRGDAGD